MLRNSTRDVTFALRVMIEKYSKRMSLCMLNPSGKEIAES